ncbi:hypothetical protein KIL84_006249 [Mauremys mutica]|uniref:Uncharacterized protein n=1 Tax=Mauremys mutica TaxID=74926 RepID=A0A9D3WZG8_9SAUR|nr:hypothetical protein KIL84_006249 [Mauremys mutica]
MSVFDSELSLIMSLPSRSSPVLCHALQLADRRKPFCFWFLVQCLNLAGTGWILAETPQPVSRRIFNQTGDFSSNQPHGGEHANLNYQAEKQRKPVMGASG